MWAQFTWGVAVGQHGIGAKLKEVSIDGMQDHFGRTDWTVQDLFTLGNPPLRREIKAVAFGSFLHMVQDSFAKGHTDRAEPLQGRKCDVVVQFAAPGIIRSFRAYNNQDSGKHGESDSRNAFSAHWSVDRPSVVEIGQVFLAFFERSASWQEIKPYVECVFAVEDPNARASAGAGFLKNR